MNDRVDWDGRLSFMGRRVFLKQVGCVGGAVVLGRLSSYATSSARDGGGARRPDVLFIVIEDIAPLMGCYGHPVVKTPHIDALARRGVLFKNAYCQVAVCNPSRACVSSGLRPQTTGVYNNSVDWRRRLPDGHLALPEFFRDHGYETVICGKIHHHQRYFKDASAEAQQREDRMWNRRLNARSKRYATPPRRPKAARPAWLKEDDYINRSIEWGPTGLEDTEQRDGAIAAAVAEELKKKHDRPLYMAVGFHAPHYPLRAPDKYWQMYPPDRVALPQNPKDDLADVPHEYSIFNTTDDRWLTVDEKREVIAAYYATISYIDACVGVLMDALEQPGRLANTIVCLWGDHGMHMGEHTLFRKYTLFENAARVPFVIAAPGVARQGAVCRQPVELLDIYPTLVDLCGFPVSGGLDGVSMRPLLADPDRRWKPAAYTSQGPKNHSLRTRRWRYTEWGGPENAELYDHENDPGEFTNLAAKPEYADTVKRLHQLLHDGWPTAARERR
ncbi:MAG: sulfatase [Sedimentisphaerales bacterium]|nr:sulfatase [Sedimentisphaerales bacterium]